MIITGKKIDFFNDLLKDWQLKNDRETARLERNMEQYLGSDVIDAVQTASSDDTDGDSDSTATSTARAKVVRNITYELIESQISTVIPSPKVTPERWSEKHQRNAESIERLLNVLRDKTDSELMNDLDERLTPIHGASMRTVDWDESVITHDTVGDVRIQLMDISHLVWQPGVFNVQDMDCVFVRYDTTRSAVMERYGVSLPVSEETEPDEDSEYPDDTVTVWTAWYRDDAGEVCKYTFSVTVELEDIGNYWSRRRRICEACGGRAEVCEDDAGVCRCGGAIIDAPDEYEELTHDILDESGNVLIPAMSPVIRGGVVQTREERRPAIDPETGSSIMSFNELGLPEPVMETVQVPLMEPTRIPWYRPKIYPICVRRNVSRNNSLLGQSDCDVIRAQQQSINKYESRILDKKMSEMFAPVKPARSAFRFDNSIGAQVLVLGEGENKGDYGAISTIVDISGDMAAAERCYAHAQRILGIPDSFVGQADTTAKSGLAKQVQVQQAAGRLASKRVMKSAAQAECDRAAFQLYLAYSDEPRPAPFTDDFGQIHNASFSRYDYIERDEYSGEYYYDDRYLFSSDLSGTVAEDNEQMWELINSDFASGLYGDPTQTVTLLRAWQARERARYPGAHKQVKYFTELLRQEAAMLQEQQAILTAENTEGGSSNDQA